MKFIIGKKIEMSQRYQDDGKVVPVTIVEAGPCVVSAIRTKEKDGYCALQMAFGSRKKVKKPILGQVQKLGISPQVLKEFRIDRENMDPLNAPQVQVGDVVRVNTFKSGDKVKVTGKSKGKGFQGVVKRHGFHGSPKSHGHKDQLRMPGSIGATDANHVLKGKRMAGRMGGDQVSVINMTIFDVDEAHNLIFIKGAVPGYRGSLVYLESYD